MSGDNKYQYDRKEYRSFEELPPEARSLYQTNNTDGLLDIYNSPERPARFEIDGQKYNSLDELPPDVKEKIIAKIAKLERQGLRLIVNKNEMTGKNPFSPQSDSQNDLTEAQLAEVSPAFKYKLFLGLIMLLAAILFIYVLISTYLKNQ